MDWDRYTMTTYNRGTLSLWRAASKLVYKQRPCRFFFCGDRTPGSEQQDTDKSVKNFLKIPTDYGFMNSKWIDNCLCVRLVAVRCAKDFIGQDREFFLI